MKIAIVHYHLKRGGVTRVIENAVGALGGGRHRIVVISGEPYSGESLPDTIAVAGLGYRNDAVSGGGRGLAASVAEAARAHFGSDPDVWHIHNHSLGKNPSFPEAVHALLEDGARVLLQVHDFPEDGRPEQFARQKQALAAIGTQIDGLLYPSAPQVHYAVLNGRDRGFLSECGAGSGQLHLLPNPVSVPRDEPGGEPDPLPDASRFYLYPTRAIRRKNLGEMLALSLMAPAGTLFATTLAPENPEWRSVYENWIDFANRHSLPVRFGIGEDPAFSAVPFSSWIARSDSLVTTSVAEGFGLAFLEPWLFGKPVYGRDLPEVTSDFRDRGVSLDTLYSRLPVPLAWVTARALRRKVEGALESSYRAYGLPLPSTACERAIESMVDGDTVDFGRMDEELQERALEQWISGGPDSHEPGIPLPWEDDSARHPDVAGNRECIATAYSLDRYAESLERIYIDVARSRPSEIGSLDGERLLRCFLDPETFNLLRA